MDIRKAIRSVVQELHNGKPRTKTAREILNLARGSRFTSDQRLVNSNGDLRDLFDYFMGIFKSKGRNLPDEFGEDEEDAFYDFALNYDKGMGYWKRMGEKIFGDMWGYGTGVDANPSAYERFMIVSVDDDKVDEAVRRVHEFGWWCDVGESSQSLHQTALIVAPIDLS